MNVFSTLESNDHTVHEFYANAPISWELQSSSLGCTVTSPSELVGGVTLNRATKDAAASAINEDTDIADYILHASIKHIFYRNGQFLSGSKVIPASADMLPDNTFVVSISTNFYGERLRPGSFNLQINAIVNEVVDDGRGNLFVGSDQVGNIFYDAGIAIIQHNTSSAVASVDADGIKIVAGDEVYVAYESDVKMFRHELNVRLRPGEFNFSPFNPSIKNRTVATGSLAEYLTEQNIAPVDNDEWALYNLMSAEVIKPYVTTIGLYNERYELLVVAKLSSPIQRTFSTEQIFIIRFDT